MYCNISYSGTSSNPEVASRNWRKRSLSKLCLFAYVYKRLFLSTARFFSHCFCGLKKLTDRSTVFVEHPVNRLLNLAFMSVVACIQKKIINYFSWWLITGSKWLDNYIMSFNRVQMHTVLLWENPRIFPTFAHRNQCVNSLLL